MTQQTREKLFQPDSNGPDVKLEFESVGQYGRLYVRERSADGWETIGVVELHAALATDYRGLCEPSEILEWAWVNYGSTRVKYSHRLVLSEGETLEVRHEKRADVVLGCDDSHAHEWELLERWDVSHESVEHWGLTDE